MLLALGIGIAIGAPAALLVRSGPMPARATAVLAMVVLALLALVPPSAVPTEVPSRLGVACTAAPETDDVAATIGSRAAATTPPPALAFAGGASGVRAAVATAALAAGPRAEELLVVWNGPVAAAEQAATGAPAAGLALTTAAPLPWPPDAVQVRALRPPVAGRPLLLEATAAGAGAPLAVTLEIADAEGPLWRGELSIPVRGGAECTCIPRAAGALAITLVANVEGHRIERRGTLAVRAPLPVLVVDPSGVAAAALKAQAVAIVAAAEVPSALDGFQAAVVGGAIPVAAQSALAQAVDGGLGLFVLGPGLQKEAEPLRELLPVFVLPGPGADEAAGPGNANRPQPRPPAPVDAPPTGRTEGAEIAPGGPVEVDKRAIAMVLLVDRSGSMGRPLPGGATKMSYAKTSALQTARALGEGDAVGIVTFGNKDLGRVVLPMTSATDRTAVEQGIAGLADAPEETYLLSGLRAADRELSKSTAAVRHVVVITDGEYVLDEDLALVQLAHEMRSRRGVTLSIVSIVAGGTQLPFLRAAELLAREGGGAFIPVEDPRSVPVVVSAEVTRALDRVGRRPGGEGPGPEAPPPEPKPPQPEPPPPDVPGPRRLPVRAVARSPLLDPEPEAWPTLGGAVAAAARIDAHVLLVAGDAGQPLLALRNVGLGRVGAFTSDLGGPDGAEFRADPAFPARFAQWVAALAAPSTAPAAEVLGETVVAPPAPSPAEAALLQAIAGRPLQPLLDWRPPPPRLEMRYRSRVPDWAVGALLALLLLALGEWFWSRRAG